MPVGRYDWDEFLIVAPDCSQEHLKKPAERLRTAVNSDLKRITREEFDFTMSLGVAFTDGTSDQDPNRMVKAADQVLYHAKNNGRKRVQFSLDRDHGQQSNQPIREALNRPLRVAGNSGESDDESTQ